MAFVADRAGFVGSVHVVEDLVVGYMVDEKAGVLGVGRVFWMVFCDPSTGQKVMVFVREDADLFNLNSHKSSDLFGLFLGIVVQKAVVGDLRSSVLVGGRSVGGRDHRG